MEIILISPRGYCKGVVRAINLAMNTAKDYPNEKITMLGMIVHNQYVIKALELKNIHCIDHKHQSRLQLLDHIDEGIVIFTAHGVSEEVITKAKKKGLKVVDASCIDVLKTQQLVKDKLQEDFEVLYVGKQFHPEAEAVLALSSRVHLITKESDLDELGHYDNVFLTNQTTMSLLEIATLFTACQKKYPHLVIADELCNATRVRQEAISKAKKLDCLFVVGDPHSNNTAKLKEIALNAKIQDVYLIETHLDIQESQLIGKNKIGVTSGASTPTYLTNKVIASLTNYATHQTLLYDEIDLENLLG